MFNRRSFMLAGSSAIISLSAMPHALASSLGKAVDFDPLSPNGGGSQKAKYAARLKQKFYARGEAGSGLLKLESIIDGPSADKLEQFTLIFSGHSELPDSLYRLTHLSSFESSYLRLDKSQLTNNKYTASFSLLS
jgi:hypothetical protein